MSRKLLSSSALSAVFLSALMVPMIQAGAQSPAIQRFFESRRTLINSMRSELIEQIREFNNDRVNIPGLTIPRGLTAYLVTEGRHDGDRAFIRGLYIDLLNRTPSTGEIAGWESQLDAGASRRDVVLGFLRSDEFRRLRGASSSSIRSSSMTSSSVSSSSSLMSSATSSSSSTSSVAITQSLDAYTVMVIRNRLQAQTNENFVRLLYQQLLNRTPSAGEVQGWVNQLTGGTSRDDVIRGFLGSAEFQGLSGIVMSDRLEVFLVAPIRDQTAALSNDNFVRQLYLLLLNRTPSAGEVQGWVNQLTGGTSRDDVIRGFLNAAEFENRIVNVF